MAPFRVGFIGTGKVPERPSLEGYAMAYRHADAYRQLGDRCTFAACADIVPENAQAFAERFDIALVYADHREMLEKEELDIVSICTWPKAHAELATAACSAGVPAVHCEKPMALTMGEARLMLQVAAQYGTKLTFNHQRRFGRPFRKAHEILHAGEIGDLVRMEANVGDLYDGGTHWIDMLGYFNDETPAAWVLGQIDCREEVLAFGAPVENQSVCQVKYRNGVIGIIVTGAREEGLGGPFRLLGSKGTIEIGWDPIPGPMLRYWRTGLSDWEVVDCEGENLHGPGYIERAIADVVDALATGRESELCARHAMNATEIIFAAYESCRRRGRVDLPLEIDDSPIAAMIAAGDLQPKSS